MDLLQAAHACLQACDPVEKVALTQQYAAAFRAGSLPLPAQADAPEPLSLIHI